MVQLQFFFQVIGVNFWFSGNVCDFFVFQEIGVMKNQDNFVDGINGYDFCEEEVKIMV